MLENTIVFLETFQKIDRAHRKYFQTKFAKYGFTPNEILVIIFLYNNAPKLDTATDISRLKNVSKGMIARSVEALCEKGYVDAIRDEKDRRIVHLHLKREHNRLAAEIESAQNEFFTGLEDGISETDMQYTRETLCKLLNNAEAYLDGRKG